MGLFSFLFGRSNATTGHPSRDVGLPLSSNSGTRIEQGWSEEVKNENLLLYFSEGKGDASRLHGKWEASLGEPPMNAVAKLVSQGLLEPCSSDEKLNRSQTVDKLKSHLKARGLRVSGAKGELIDRLLNGDPDGVRSLVHDVHLLRCTPSGLRVAQQRRAYLDVLQSRLVEQSLDLVRSSRYADAYELAADYKGQIPHSDHDGSPFEMEDPDPVGTLTRLAASRPKTFGELPDHKWEALRVAAAMCSMWTGTLQSWLPDNFEQIRSFGHGNIWAQLHASASSAKRRADLRKWNARDITISNGRGVEACAACRLLLSRRWNAEELPELPFAGCTNESAGCACSYHWRPSFGE